MRFQLLSIVFITLFIGACRKKENQLPVATHSGQNIFACKINGKDFIATLYTGSLFVNGVSYVFVNSNTVIVDGITLNPHYEVTIACHFNNSPGTFQIGNIWPVGASYFDDTKGTLNTGDNQFNTDSTHSGSVNFTYYNGNILAGTFAFDCINSSGSIVHITEGRFDLTQQ